MKNPEEINEVLINATETINELRKTVATQKELIAKLEQRLEAGQHETIVMLPCPFCSGDAILNKRKNGNFEVGCDSKECYGWSCNDSLCECEDGFTSKRKAIEKWNQRAT